MCVDVLEGKGKTGRLDHRGRHYADTRVGIGVILDLGIHALAPLMSLESRIGRLRRESLVRLRTAICGRFLRSVQRRYKVPSPFVPETYAELLLQTTTGVRVLISLGKYLPKGENQRRLLLVGSEGVAILDMSSCTLSLGLRDQCPATILKSPKLKDSKYVAVLRCCLEYLQGRSPFKFDEFDICLRANELALHAYARSRCRGRARKKYATGSPPGAVFGNARELSAGDS